MTTGRSPGTVQRAPQARQRLGRRSAGRVLLLGLREPLPGQSSRVRMMSPLDFHSSGIGGAVRARSLPRGRPARLHPGGDRRLVARFERVEVAPLGRGVRQVLLLDVRALELGRVAIADADPVVLEPPVGGIAQMVRDGQRPFALDVGDRVPVGLPAADALRRGGEVDGRLGERVLGLGQADPIEGLAPRWPPRTRSCHVAAARARGACSRSGTHRGRTACVNFAQPVCGGSVTSITADPIERRVPGGRFAMLMSRFT